jgi:hypothetical protein
MSSRNSPPWDLSIDQEHYLQRKQLELAKMYNSSYGLDPSINQQGMPIVRRATNSNTDNSRRDKLLLLLEKE